MRIRGKFSLLASGLVVLVLTLTGLLQHIFQRRTLVAEQRRQQEDTVRQLVRVCEDALLEKPGQPMTTYTTSMFELNPVSYSALLVNYTKTLLMLEPILSIALVSVDGTPLFHSALLAGDVTYMAANHAGDDETVFALSAKDLASQLIERSGRRVLEYVHPVKDQGRIAAAVYVAYDQRAVEARLDAVLRASLKRFLLVALVCLLFGVTGAAALAENFTSPLERLVEGARKIGTGDLKHKIPTGRSDELGQLSEEFNMMGQKLAELDELKQSFLETITHDLRSPLVSIMGYIDIILSGLSGPVSEKQTGQLKIVQNSAGQLSQLVNNILDISKLEAGAMKMDFQPVQLTDLLSEVHQQMVIVAQKYKVSLEADAPAELPRMQMDLDLMRRVITNLVSNSLKFTPEGGKVTIKAALEDPQTVRVAVIDTGCGIPKDKLKYMFTKFFQVEETKKQARKRGTGLGLTICKQVVEGHGGRIWVESEWQKGSSFIFTLPIKPPAAAEQEPAPPPPAVPAATRPS